MSQTMPAIHIPVLLNEAIDALRVEPGGRYIDCTVGEGGHTAAVLERGGRVLGIDIDPQAIEVARARLLPYGKLAILINNSFDALDQICSSLGFRPVRGILFDLGMSSFQLSNTKRGFSFQYDAPLDMRFSPTQELTAATIVNTFPEEEIASIIERYGEERRSTEIARSIVQNRPFFYIFLAFTTFLNCISFTDFVFYFFVLMFITGIILIIIFFIRYFKKVM